MSKKKFQGKLKKKGTVPVFTTPLEKCMKKRTFDTEKEALEEMKWLRVSREYKKLKAAYKCDSCDKWHLTKTPREELK